MNFRHAAAFALWYFVLQGHIPTQVGPFATSTACSDFAAKAVAAGESYGYYVTACFSSQSTAKQKWYFLNYGQGAAQIGPFGSQVACDDFQIQALPYEYANSPCFNSAADK